MNKPHVGGFVKTPKIDNDYLTSFTEYEVINTWEFSNVFVILDDNGEKRCCKLLEDGHLNMKDWTLIKKDELHS
jgi:hypothetical protein